MPAYALLGTSRVLSVSTTSTLSLLTATAIGGFAVTVLGVIEELDKELRGAQHRVVVLALSTGPHELLRRSDLASHFQGRLFPTIDAALAETKDRHHRSR
jgi:MFS superfamily sulfate permease-like transporter